jgi:hypothetical protein
VFCTTCKGRQAHLAATLLKNIADNADYARCKFVVVDYGGDDTLEAFLQGEAFAPFIASGRLTVYRYDWVGPFRMAHAKNMAHRCGIIEGADVLVNIDADNFTGAGFASYIAEQLSSSSGDGEPFFRPTMEQPLTDYGICGRIGMTRHAFLKIGGYDERFTTYAPDDRDMILRLQRIGCQPVDIESRFLSAISHSDEMRFKDYNRPGPDPWHSVQFSEATIANYGQVGMGVVTRNFGADRIEFGCQPKIELGRLPTRIFGIGMHKTGTTSLHGALRILGLDSLHWAGVAMARSLWHEISATGRALAVESHYALADLPISILYEKLDKAYPGSKFILTLRDEEAWIRSIEKHWNRAHNPYRENWNVDQFSHTLHKMVYGQSTFNAPLFLARYRQHNEQVMAYFRSRPKDLLVMDMGQGPDAGKTSGWPELCRFLNLPAPAVPYPALPSASA